MQFTEDDKKIIYHLRKLLLFDKGNTWMKKEKDLFDVAKRPMMVLKYANLPENFY